jgi:hypothetical protein
MEYGRGIHEQWKFIERILDRTSGKLDRKQSRCVVDVLCECSCPLTLAEKICLFSPEKISDDMVHLLGNAREDVRVAAALLLAYWGRVDGYDVLIESISSMGAGCLLAITYVSDRTELRDRLSQSILQALKSDDFRMLTITVEYVYALTSMRIALPSMIRDRLLELPPAWQLQAAIRENSRICGGA